MAFITKDVNFFYSVMPFGLKNAGETYQRMMDRVFKQQIGKHGCQVSKHTPTCGGPVISFRGTPQIRHAPQP